MNGRIGALSCWFPSGFVRRLRYCGPTRCERGQQHQFASGTMHSAHQAARIRQRDAILVKSSVYSAHSLSPTLDASVLPGAARLAVAATSPNGDRTAPLRASPPPPASPAVQFPDRPLGLRRRSTPLRLLVAISGAAPQALPPHRCARPLAVRPRHESGWRLLVWL